LVAVVIVIVIFVHHGLKDIGRVLQHRTVPLEARCFIVHGQRRAGYFSPRGEHSVIVLFHGLAEPYGVNMAFNASFK
jgi:hypothetical protein